MSGSGRRRRHQRHEFTDLPSYRPRGRERRRGRARKRRLQTWSHYRRVVLGVAATVVFLGVAAVIWSRESSDLDHQLAQAIELHHQGALDGATSALKDILVSNPDHIRARWELGQVLISSEDGAAALKELEKAESLGFRDPQLFPSKLVALVLDGKFAQALRQLVFVSDLESDVVLLEIQARAQLGLGRSEAARATLEKVVELAPQQPSGRLWLGRVALRQGDLTVATEQVDVLIGAPSPSAQAWLLKGEVDLVSGHSEGAELAFRAALQITPSNVPAKLGLARALLLQSRPEPAEKHLAEILQFAPGHPLATFLRAHASMQRGADDSAIEYAQEVISRYPKHPPTLVLLGTLYAKRGDLARAELLLRRLVAGDPDHVQAQMLLAGVELRTGAAASAVTRLERARAGTR